MHSATLQAGDFTYIDADEVWQQRAMQRWTYLKPKHFRRDDGFAIVATEAQHLVGLLCVQWRTLPEPMPPTTEAFIDFVEVVAAHRRKGVCRAMIDVARRRAREYGAYQMRGWSSFDKTEAIPTWRALGFGMCPTFERHGEQDIHGYQFACAV